MFLTKRCPFQIHWTRFSLISKIPTYVWDKKEWRTFARSRIFQGFLRIVKKIKEQELLSFVCLLTCLNLNLSIYIWFHFFKHFLSSLKTKFSFRIYNNMLPIDIAVCRTLGSSRCIQKMWMHLNLWSDFFKVRHTWLIITLQNNIVKYKKLVADVLSWKNVNRPFIRRYSSPSPVTWFRSEITVTSFLHLMVLFWKVFINSFSK